MLLVADDTDDKVYAYTLATGVRVAGSDITLHADNAAPTGLWGTSTHLYVAENSLADNVGDRWLVYVYDRSTGARDTDKEFRLLGGNGRTTGLWSDGTTLWRTDVQVLRGHRLHFGDPGKGQWQGIPACELQNQHLGRYGNLVGWRNRLDKGEHRRRQTLLLQNATSHHGRHHARQPHRSPRHPRRNRDPAPHVHLRHPHISDGSPQQRRAGDHHPHEEQHSFNRDVLQFIRRCA